MKPHLEQSADLAALIDAAVQALVAAEISTARLDAEVLMAEAAGVSRAAVVSGSLVPDAAIVTRWADFIARRCAREPLAYIVGHKEFFSLDFQVTPAVLIPRPETETLVAASLAAIADRAASLVADLGTGSGAIAVAISANAPGARVVATDISQAVLEVARCNARRHRCADRVEFRLGDCFEALRDDNLEGRFDLVVSNPPYVADREIAALAPEVAEFEPRAALAGGADGLDFYRRIVPRVPAFLKPQGELMVEVGAGQAARVIEICRAAGLVEAAAIGDLTGIERVVRARR